MERKPIKDAPQDGTPIIAWEYADELPVIAKWSEVAERFEVPSRHPFTALATKYAQWIPLPESEAA